LEYVLVSSQIVASVAAVALLGAGLANAGDIRASQAIAPAVSTFGAGADAGGSSDEKCRVDVDRSGTAGTADITRRQLDNGKCVCIVTTGKESVNGAAEEVVTALRRDKTCVGAPLAAAAGGAAGGGAAGGAAAGAAGAAGGGAGVLIPVILGGAAAAGLAVGMGKSSKG
jgi:hypothetical protein